MVDSTPFSGKGKNGKIRESAGKDMLLKDGSF